MCSKLFQELTNNNIVFVPSNLTSSFICYCLVRKNCRPCGGAIETDGQYFYL